MNELFEELDKLTASNNNTDFSTSDYEVEEFKE